MFICERCKTFLADVDYVRSENANKTRAITPSTATVPLQVVMGSYKNKETTAPKSRRFQWTCQIVCCTTAFFFCRRAAGWNKFECCKLIFIISNCLIVCGVHFEVCQVKIDIFSIDFEKTRKRTQILNAVLLIQVMAWTLLLRASRFNCSKLFSLAKAMIVSVRAGAAPQP